jgi:hypothetical protein
MEFFYLQRHGGILPLRRKHRPDALTVREREEIAKGLAAKLSLRESLAGYPEVPLRSAGSSRALVGEGATIRIAARKPADSARAGPSPAS